MRMKLIPITQGYSVKVDDEDYDRLMKNHWAYHIGYAVRGRRQGKITHLIRMHRQIMGEPEGLVVDHINGDKLDNTRANLRVATWGQNLANRGLNKNNTSGYRGVSLSSSGRWVAKIKVDRQVIHLGTFNTALEAHEVYKEASIKYFGNFAQA